ncbi:MAG: NUDIX hydrolase [Patescibacteria group bacterium]|jgi:8-oxo-dGTP diphosphatase
MVKEFEYFQIGQKGILIRDNKILIVKLADQIDIWDLPGGRLDKGEFAEEAFRREIKEEIGFDDFNILGIVDHEIWYTKNGTPFCGIANLIKNEKDKIKLSPEHTDYKWIAETEIDDYKYIWKNMDRMIKKGFERYKYLKNNEK